MILNGAVATLKSCAINANIALQNEGGGLHITDSNATINACTIANNNATRGRGGAVFLKDSFMTFTSCIISGNRAQVCIKTKSGEAHFCVRSRRI